MPLLIEQGPPLSEINSRPLPLTKTPAWPAAFGPPSRSPPVLRSPSLAAGAHSESRVAHSAMPRRLVSSSPATTMMASKHLAPRPTSRQHALPDPALNFTTHALLPSHDAAAAAQGSAHNLTDSRRAKLHPLRQYSSFFPTRSLAGTVADHTAYVLLHTHAPPSEYPARSKSPLWRQLTLKARAWGGIVNFGWAPEHALHPRYTGLGEGADGGGLGEQEAYAASVFSASHRGRLHIPEVTLANVDVIDAEICAHVQPGVPNPNATEAHGETGQSASSSLSRWQPLDKRLFLYVCTHGSRDCRCGDAGGEVARALRSQVVERGIGDEVCIGEVAHVGGHKYAANVLVYPYGEWLGNVQAADVPQVVEEVVAWHAMHGDRDSQSASGKLPPVCAAFWRGRMGLDKDSQLALVSKMS